MDAPVLHYLNNSILIKPLLLLALLVSEENIKKRAAYRVPVEAPHAPAVGATPIILATLIPVVVICLDLRFLVKEIRRRMIRNIRHMVKNMKHGRCQR